jgi:hypothetical protein
VIARLEVAPAEGSVIRNVWLLRLRALLARARGDEAGYRDYRDRYRAMATSLGFETHEVGGGDAVTRAELARTLDPHAFEKNVRESQMWSFEAIAVRHGPAGAGRRMPTADMQVS